MEGTTAGALILEIVRRGFQDLLEADVSAAIGAQRHERCPEEGATHRNAYRQRVLTTQVGDLTLAIPKLRQGSVFPNWLEPRRRVGRTPRVPVRAGGWAGGVRARGSRPFALDIAMAGAADAPRREQLGRASLQALGILPSLFRQPAPAP